MSTDNLPTKSLIIAILLVVFLGPLGLFYVSIVGALVMLVITAIIAVITFGFGLFIPYVISIIWAIIAVNGHNKTIKNLTK